MENLLTPGVIPPGILIIIVFYHFSGKLKVLEARLHENEKELKQYRDDTQSTAILLATLTAKVEGIQVALAGLSEKMDRRNAIFEVLQNENRAGRGQY